MSAFKNEGKRTVSSGHVLWLVVFAVSQENVRKYMVQLTSAATKATGEICYSRTVIPVRRTGEPLGFAFVWLTSTKCFEWILKNVADFPPLQMTSEELARARGYKFDEDLGQFAKDGSFNPQIQISLANYFETEDPQSNDALICRQELPSWLSLDLLAKEARCYMTQAKMRIYMSKGKKPRPVIVYAQGSNDGLFAFQMMRLLHVVNPNNPKESVDLVFDHAWKSVVRY